MTAATTRRVVRDVEHDELKQLVEYDDATGLLRWRVSRAGGAKAGDIVGSFDSQGYMRTRICGKPCLLHRLVWFYVHGSWPKGVIDHVNGDRADNRITNLRDVSNAANVQNQKKAQRSNKSTGMLGVTPIQRSKLLAAKIVVNGRSLYLGAFATPELAHEAYVQAKRIHHEGNTL